jgi:glycolate oxidase FAD binding subunit
MPATPTDTKLDPAAFTAALGKQALISKERDRYTVDGVTPQLVVKPPTADAIALALREASAQGAAVILHGGRTATVVGNVPERYDVAIDTTALDSIEAFESADLTVTVQAGLPMADLAHALADRSQFVPLDVPHADRATVGGVVALGRGGHRRATHGTVRDWLIGCSVVLADGTRVKGGGRVVKNVSGYDLPKLFAGSFGTLACIVDATFKLRPLPAADHSLALAASDFDAALAFGQTLARDLPGLHAVVAVDAPTAAMLNLGHAALIVRAGGLQESVVSLLEAVTALAVGAQRVANPPRAPGGAGPPSDPEWWQLVTDLERPDPPASGMIWRCGVAPTSLSEARDAIRAIDAEARLWSYVDTGLLFAEVASQDAAQSASTLRAARKAIVALGGSLVVESAPPGLKPVLNVWGETGGLDIMRRIKQQFDPNRTLSPGRFVGGI